MSLAIAGLSLGLLAAFGSSENREALDQGFASFIYSTMGVGLMLLAAALWNTVTAPGRMEEGAREAHRIELARMEQEQAEAIAALEEKLHSVQRARDEATARLADLQAGIKVSPGVSERAAMSVFSDSGGTTAWSRDAVLRINNSGRSRFTVNVAGWLASDGAELAANRRAKTIEPGSPEEIFKVDAAKLVELHDTHRAVAACYVELAGETDRRLFDLPEDWISSLREVAARPRVTRR